MTVPQANDLQTAATWRKSRRSQNEGACVEVKNDLRAFRDSKNPGGPVLTVPGSPLFAALKSDQIAS